MTSRTIVQYGLYTSIFLIMGLVPYLGYIQIGPVRATLMGIPLVTISIHKQYKGVIFGCIMFGITSFISAPYNSVIFGVIGWSGIALNLLLPRLVLMLPILLAIFIFKYFKLNILVKSYFIGLITTLFNTTLVLFAFAMWGYKENTIEMWFILLAPNIIFEWITIPFICSFLGTMISTLINHDKKNYYAKF